MRQTPAPGSSLLMHSGDSLTFTLDVGSGRRGTAVLRTSLGGAVIRRREIIESIDESRPALALEWSDIPMTEVEPGVHKVRLPLVQIGSFLAKACFFPEGGARAEWPDGADVKIKTTSAWTCCGASIYTAFPRQFGDACEAEFSTPEDPALKKMDEEGWTVIPRGGTFRSLIKKLDVILGEERFRILQLLPIHPVPTTFARMGRFGSPFAGTDFLGVDPALAEFDKSATPLDQFHELVGAVHTRGARIFMDLPANHTGWASALQIHHPDWFVRAADGKFVSPGAWGVIWEDLVALDYSKPRLRDFMAKVFEFWCRQGVDGFRCDAGYMVPAEVWRYIVARVREQYPETVFLLEGLGGKLSVTRQLIEDEGLDWAYSEVFQTEDRRAFERYLPGVLDVSSQMGPLVHFAETHDNNRLAAHSHAYSRMRTALAALISHSGCFGITNGVEWFASEKVDVHGASALRWGNPDNQVGFIGRLNSILEVSPAFSAGARVRMVQMQDGNSLAVVRTPADGDAAGSVLVLINLSASVAQSVSWPASEFDPAGAEVCDLIRGAVQTLPQAVNGFYSVRLEAGQVLCLTPDLTVCAKVNSVLASLRLFKPAVVERQELRSHALRVRAALTGGKPLRQEEDVDAMALKLAEDPVAFMTSFLPEGDMPPVTEGVVPRALGRVIMVPPGHFILLRAPHPFHCMVVNDEDGRVRNSLQCSESAAGDYFALLSPMKRIGKRSAKARIHVDIYEFGEKARRVFVQLLMLPDTSYKGPMARRVFSGAEVLRNDYVALLTNGRGAMAHVRAKWGEVRTQYDALLAANPDPDVPCDRQMLFTRCRAWVVNHGFSTEINSYCLERFECSTRSGEAKWVFRAPVGTGRNVELTFLLVLHRDENRVTLSITRSPRDGDLELLDDSGTVQLILRPDIESRNFHAKTKAFAGAERDWPQCVNMLPGGFEFRPQGVPGLVMRISEGAFVHEQEWHYMVGHSLDAERGQDGSSDLYSPGWFTATIEGGDSMELDAECLCNGQPLLGAVRGLGAVAADNRPVISTVRNALSDAMRDFVVKRDDLMTVIAGYPWFLDWGRDTFIVLRGMIADGMTAESLGIIRKFGEFEKGGTLPNMINGMDASNRDTSDAQLWYAVAVNDLIDKLGAEKVLEADCGGRTVRDVLLSIAEGYMSGTVNGIKMDPESALVYSPSHYTWMDTNHPAGTPRAGYPVEIQALWIATLNLVAKLDETGPWGGLLSRAKQSLAKYFWLEGRRFLSDCLHAESFTPAAHAVADDHLRCNQLFVITVGGFNDHAKCRDILRATEKLLVPGGIRTLDSAGETNYRLPIYKDGRLLNDPAHPYWGRYEGDEDTRRKPAYHNGTAWTWPYPSFAEALVIVHGESAKSAARALIGVAADLLEEDCIGHLPEIMDGDAPHKGRGCDAQAWGASEFLRLAILLGM